MGLLEDWLRTITVLVGTIGLGAMGLSGLVNVLSGVIEPSVKWDPQGEFSYILSLPMGALLGGTVGVGLLRQEKPTTKAPYMFVIVGALTVTLCLGIGFLSADSRGLGLQELLRTITSPWCLPPFIASSALFARGIYLIRKLQADGIAINVPASFDSQSS